MIQRNDLKKEIDLHHHRLQLLKEKKAVLGISADPSLDIEIEEVGTKVMLLQNELDGLDTNRSELTAPMAESCLSWQDLQLVSQCQLARFFKELDGQSNKHGAYIRPTYTCRQSIEPIFRDFLRSDAIAFILLGNAGFGKTNILCHWTEDLLESDNCVFYYNCAGSIRHDIDLELAHDLSVELNRLPHVLRQFDDIPRNEQKYFVLIFDAVNEYSGGDQAMCATLVKEIDSLVGRLAVGNLRIVLSSTGYSWKYLDRIGNLNLFWSRYFQPECGQAITVPRFTKEELEHAYGRYSDFFGLHQSFSQMSSSLKDQLRDPLMLRILAEGQVYRHGQMILPVLPSEVVQQYIQTNVSRPDDLRFVKRLAAKFLVHEKSVIYVNDLYEDEEFLKLMLDSDLRSSYRRMLDRGILIESSGNTIAGDTVRFNHDRVAAYLIAVELILNKNDVVTTIEEMLELPTRFDLSWGIANTLLQLQNDDVTFIMLAQSTNARVRELTTEGIVALSIQDRDRANNLVVQILQTDSVGAQQTGLKAAYYIGQQAQDVFFWISRQSDATKLRQNAKYTLYLIWRHDPAFVNALLDGMADQIRLDALPHLASILEFMIDMVVTIYINHCDKEGIIARDSPMENIGYKVLVEKLHADTLDNIQIIGPALKKLIFKAMASAFSRRILMAIIPTEIEEVDRFFTAPVEERQLVDKAIHLIEPGADLQQATTTLEQLLNSNLILTNFVGALILGIHAFQDFDESRPIIERLFETVKEQGRLWILFSFSVLLMRSPRNWTNTLEIFTRHLIEETAVYFDEKASSSILATFDFALLPLGLSYGRHGTAMSLFEELITNCYEQGDITALTRHLDSIGPVGFYYPEAVLSTLEASISDYRDSRVQNALVKPLATIRTLHLDLVDAFMERIGAGKNFRYQVESATNVELVDRYIYWIGMYNNAVHEAVFYPKMRRGFLIGGLRILTEVNSAEEFVIKYTPIPLKMISDAQYRASNWTK